MREGKSEKEKAWSFIDSAKGSGACVPQGANAWLRVSTGMEL